MKRVEKNKELYRILEEEKRKNDECRQVIDEMFEDSINKLNRMYEAYYELSARKNGEK